MGASRVDPQRPVNLLGGEAVELPGGRQRGVGDQDVDLPRVCEQR